MGEARAEAVASATGREGGGSGMPVPRGGSLQVQSGFYEGYEIDLDRDWLVIGRGRSADMIIAEATISRAHAAVGYDDEGFYVQDLGSTNGTTVNGGRIERHLLKTGDEIQMGRLRVAVSLPGA